MMRRLRKEFKEKAIFALKVVGKASLRVGIKALTAGVLDETILDNTSNVKDASKEASDLVDGFISNQFCKAEHDRKNLATFKEYLAELGEKLSSEKKVIFIIDELDRCKPKFALDLIESIKHLFSVPNITFVLVMNRDQLEEAVRSEYGSGVDAARYLQKFVSIWSSLPKPRANYQSVPKIYLKNCLSRMGYQENRSQQTAIEVVEEIITYYDLSLHEIEQCLTNFAIIKNATDSNL
jgi:predicted KAP-like P-loop ATPase